MYYIAFNRRSSITAKALREYISSKGETCRIINDKKFKFKPDVLIRYGNSYLDCPDGAIEINSKEAVRLASNKLMMAYTLIRAGVKFPKCYIPPSSAILIGREFNLEGENGTYSIDGVNPMENGLDLYYRNSVGIVRRRGHYIQGDLYGTEPIDRAREFRVHVFNGRTIGVYEKLPHNEGTLYCKNDNCDFKRVDMSEESNRSELIGVRPEARKAVESLGLLFGGVDVIISKSGEIFVNEVNSAPSLNGPNLERYFEEIQKYISNGQEEEASQKEG